MIENTVKKANNDKHKDTVVNTPIQGAGWEWN